MDQVHVVRHKVLVEGRSQRAVARELGLARVTVRKLDEAAPARKPAPVARPRPVWDAVAPRVEALLAESVRWTGGKQRLSGVNYLPEPSFRWPALPRNALMQRPLMAMRKRGGAQPPVATL